jgi:hypothetical protein
MSEHDEQKALFDWAESMIAQGRIPELKNMFAIPNGGMRNKAVAVKLKQEGVKRGVLDIFLAMPSPAWNGLFIEMKDGDNVLSPDQREWKKRLEENGYRCEICRSWLAAARVLIDYLRREKLEFPEFFE